MTLIFGKGGLDLYLTNMHEALACGRVWMRLGLGDGNRGHRVQLLLSSGVQSGSGRKEMSGEVWAGGGGGLGEMTRSRRPLSLALKRRSILDRDVVNKIQKQLGNGDKNILGRRFGLPGNIYTGKECSLPRFINLISAARSTNSLLSPWLPACLPCLPPPPHSF